MLTVVTFLSPASPRASKIFEWSLPHELLALNGFFVALFTGSAWLFHRAARESSGAQLA